MKKKILVMMAAVALLGCSVAQAALTDPVRDMLVSHKFLAIFTDKQRTNVDIKDGVPYITTQMADNPAYNDVKQVVAENGSRRLLIMSRPSLFAQEEQDWDVEYILTEGENGFASRRYVGKVEKMKLVPYRMPNGELTITKKGIDTDKKMKKGMEQRFRQYFLPLLPEENKLTLPNGKEGKRVYCTEYGGSGTEAIDGHTYQYEEYINPAGEGDYKETMRYYFSDGELKLVIYDASWMSSTAPGRVCDCLILDRFTGTFDESVFIPPEKKKMAAADFMGMNLEL